MDDTAGCSGTLDFDGVLRYLRGLAGPCEPPIGVGAFLLLYASAAEVVVWYLPAREAHREGEVAIPCAALSAAWSALAGGTALDEAALDRIGGNAVYGRWLLGLLAQIPGVWVRAEPLSLGWSPPEHEKKEEEAVGVDVVAAEQPAPVEGRQGRRRRRGRSGVTAPVEVVG